MVFFGKGVFAAVAASVVLALASNIRAQTLTGLNLFRANSAGTSPLNAADSTIGGSNNSNYVMYGLAGLPAASLNISNPFLNSGDLATAPTRIAFNLATPGTYSYTFLMDTGANGEISYGTGEVGMNFFFDGNDITPDISVLAYANSTSASYYPSFAADSAAVTDTLDVPVNGSVAGAGTLAFVDGGDRITLTEFRDTVATIYNVDRVSGYSLGANGNHDSVMEFTLQVTAVPEPTSFITLGASSLLLLGRARRQQK